MSILSFLFGKPDPTLAWPLSTGAAPEFDVANGTLGPLRFGGALDEARAFGRPDAARWKSRDLLELLWARWGLLAEFAEGRLSYLAWLVGPDPFVPEHRDLRFARPHPAGGPEFDGRTTERDLEAWLGPPDRRDADEEEIVIEWEKNGLVLEFELTAAGALKRWNVSEA